MPPENLRTLRSQAKSLRRQVDRVLHAADGRLMQPQSQRNNRRPGASSDWTWQPDVWKGPVSPRGIAGAANRSTIGEEIKVFHDCPLAEIALRQIVNDEVSVFAAFGLRLEVFRFEGSFLSLAIELPDELRHSIQSNHILALRTFIEQERGSEIFARLNIRNGPNTARLVREIDPRYSEVETEFDLAYAQFNPARIEAMWVEIILESPAMNAVNLRDFSLGRRSRAGV